MRALAVALAFLLGAPASASERLPFKGVTAVRIANYAAPSKLLEHRAEFAPLVDELNHLGGKPWRRGDTKMRCYSTIWVIAGKKNIGLLRVDKDWIVDRQIDKGEATYSLAIGASDVPRITKALAELPPAKCGIPTE